MCHVTRAVGWVMAFGLMPIRYGIEALAPKGLAKLPPMFGPIHSWAFDM